MNNYIIRVINNKNNDKFNYLYYDKKIIKLMIKNILMNV